ncbi:hypothetical protein HDIA_4095 [Hartmannibacter diazotrophicus]|uniref:Uncharacterized protein n=1 Tax=Hartmannibacter diazotrophicus TaxID=1482074 RepID=A0A2C9DBK1_9HYPH|nr:hypothetical protein HDIA_4095 [Hartmannibacter diazotrophicus]
MWPQGPKVVNARIRELIEQYMPKEIDGPAQDPLAPIFTETPDRPIDLAPMRPGSGLTDGPAQRDLYDELRDKMHDAVALGRNVLGSLNDPVAKALAVMPEDFSAANPTRMWSRMNTLRRRHAAHEAVKASDEPHPDKLEPGTAEYLRDILDTYNPLASSDTKLRELDARRPGPQEVETAKEVVKPLLDAVADEIKDREIVSEDAALEVGDAIEALKEGGDNLNGRLGAEQGLRTFGNLLAAGINTVWHFGFDQSGKFAAKARDAAGQEAGKWIARSPIVLALGRFIAIYAAELKAFAAVHFSNPKVLHIIDLIASWFGG